MIYCKRASLAKIKHFEEIPPNSCQIFFIVLKQFNVTFIFRLKFLFFVLKYPRAKTRATNGLLQCDQKKSPNVYKKLPKNDFTRKMNDFDNFTKIA